MISGADEGIQDLLKRLFTHMTHTHIHTHTCGLFEKFSAKGIFSYKMRTIWFSKAQEISGGPITRIGEEKIMYQILCAKILKGKGLKEITEHRCEADKAKMYRKEIEHGGVNSINLFMINSGQVLLWRR